METYEVKAEWPEKLWKAYKLTDRTYYDEYLFACKDKIPAKKRNFDTFLSWQRARDLGKDIEQRTHRIQSNADVFQPFGWVPRAGEFLALLE